MTKLSLLGQLSLTVQAALKELPTKSHTW